MRNVMKTKQSKYAMVKSLGIYLFAAFFINIPISATAQEDTTPPILLEFSIGPLTFDTGPGPVTIEWCVTARDDLSGIRNVGLVFGPASGTRTVSGIGFPEPFPIEASGCDQFIVNQFSEYGIHRIGVSVYDAFRPRYYWHPDISSDPDMINLCTFED